MEVILKMAAPRNLTAGVDVRQHWDEESGLLGGKRDGDGDEDSPTTKKSIGVRFENRYPLNRYEMVTAAVIFLLLLCGMFCVYLVMPEAGDGKALRVPRSISELRVLK